MSIEDIIAEEMENVRRRKRINQFWKYLTVFYSLGIATIYIFMLTIGGISGANALYLQFLTFALIVIGMLVLLSPKAASFLAGVEENRARKQ